ncbi:MAG TPA: thioredoxin domain-containing protein [Kofleriaceae bacterium]|nr:thioredoxin domain-containing protein [Kofleriaceae bacterium]
MVRPLHDGRARGRQGRPRHRRPGRGPKVDFDRNPDLAARFGISSVPTFAVFKDGRPVKVQPGAVRSDALLQLVRQAG